MKHNFKLVVIAFLANLPESKVEQFNEAFRLYKQTEAKNPGVEMRINRVGFSEEGLANLLYDLQKLNDITDLDVQSYSDLQNTKAYEDDHFCQEVKEKAEEVLEVLNLDGEVVGKIKEEIFETPNIVTTDDSKPLRDEFPFLNDETCPQLLYVVVGKKIAAFKRYEENHAKLQQIAEGTLQVTEEEQLAITKAAEQAFGENRSLYAELNHYATTGEILGKHPLFKETEIAREVEVMTNDEMFKFIKASATFFSRAKNDLIKAQGNAEKTETINAKVAERQYKLDLVNAKLGISE